MGYQLEKRKLAGEEKHSRRSFLEYDIEYLIFQNGEGGELSELNSFLERLSFECERGIREKAVPMLKTQYDSLSLYEQKFKFKPYKYRLELFALNTDAEILNIQIKAELSQNGRCIMKKQIPIFWNVGFACLCDK